MKVETYECEETKTEHPEIAQEAIELINKLGLNGQQQLIAKPAEKPQERCPYREMKKDEIFVLKTLCPQFVDVEKYSAAPMPIRVLQVLEHAKSLQMFERFQVWCAEGEVKDPVLVAYRNSDTWRNDNHPFILARWAEELDAWPQLVKKALQVWKEKAKLSLAKIKSQIERDMKLVEENDSIVLPTKKEDVSYYGFGD